MKYLGSKNRIKKDIINIIHTYINKETSFYIEPFCGGCNIIDDVIFDRKIAYDKHEYLIQFLSEIKKGWLPPEEITNDHYLEVKDSFYKKDYLFPTYYYGAIGFLGGFRNLFFDTPACHDYVSEGKIRNNYKEARRNILKQSPKLQNIILMNRDYKYIEIPSNSVIYCDPPYQNTSQKGYSDNNTFDYMYFWDWVRKQSVNNTVLVSEYNAPDDFKCIWKKNVSTNLSVGSRKKDTEKLFILRRY